MKKNLVLLPVLAIICWFVYDKFINNFHTIIDNKFYRSAQLDGLTLSDIITENKIATVVNLRGYNPKSEWYLQEKQATLKLNTNHVDIKLSVYGQPQINRVKALVDIIQSQPKPILFHCKRGADRTGLASAITLLLEGQNNIFEIEDQVSWFYQSVENNSTGKLFISQYHNWLDSHKIIHSPKIFLDWLDKDYHDDDGNMLYTLEQINDIVVADIIDDIQLPVINIDRTQYETLQITGWTIDYVGKTVPDYVQVLLSKRPFKNMETGIHRPGVVKFFKHSEFLPSGWKASEHMNNLANGCYDVQLVFTRANNETWTSKPKVKVCIKS